MTTATIGYEHGSHGEPHFEQVINEQIMHKEKMDAAWEAIRAQREKLLGEGAQKFLLEIPDIKKCFERQESGYSVLCIDEGCCGEGCHTAGSGCLNKDTDALIAELKAAGVTEFTTHAGCGAWALANPDTKDQEDLDRTAREWGEAIAAKAGLPHRYIEKLERPEFHNAICAVYDATGRLNRKGSTEFPQAFITSPTCFDSAKDDIALAAKIALGDHGFGDKFTPENPFVLIAVTDSKNTDPRFSRGQALEDLQNVLRMLPDGVIKIDTFEI